MDDGSKSGADRQSGGGESAAARADGEEVQAFILDRHRSEVHLLLDNLATNPDVTIPTLQQQSFLQEPDVDWIKKICEITWPPTADQAELSQRAENAAFLIKVRDYLNGLARPASGATIAFTVLVTQANFAPENEDAPSRCSLAKEAYPDYPAQAQRFRRWMHWLNRSLLALLAVTFFLSCYVAYGNAVLNDYRAAQTSVAEARAGVVQIEVSARRDDDGGEEREVRREPTPAPAAGTAQQASDPLPGCVSRAVVPIELREACHTLEKRHRELREAEAGLGYYSVLGSGLMSAWLINLLGSSVLPVLYGLLGAIAAVIRSLSHKMRASVLSPRDLQLSIQQLVLGALIGACISLFVGGPTNGGSTDTLLGPVALSPSAIAFVAGFGVEAVFQTLESLIARIFNIAAPAAPPKIGGTQAPRNPARDDQ